ncbi:MAG: cytochrome c peroxidase [Ferruginibacter sp.]
MKLKIVLSFFIFTAAALMLISAGKGWHGPTPTPLKIPVGFPKPPTDIFKTNPLTEEGFQLGKKLFYDGGLSKDGEISCGSCHQPFAAFSTYDHDLSHGVKNSFSTRNAPALINLAWMRDLHWDGGINHIEVQPLFPLTAPNEMGMRLDSIMIHLKRDTAYRRMFRNAFGDANISSERMLKALAQFTGSLVSADSKYDKVKRGEATFIEPEKKGYELFKANCNTCHREPLFTDNDFHNNGMSLNRFKDNGRQGISLKRTDSLKFKVPTLRNIALTIPYMHDGRIATLDMVMDHYTSLDTGLVALDPLLRHKITMTPKEKKQLVFFLYTLTDTAFTRNKRYAP